MYHKWNYNPDTGLGEAHLTLENGGSYYFIVQSPQSADLNLLLTNTTDDRKNAVLMDYAQSHGVKLGELGAK